VSFVKEDLLLHAFDQCFRAFNAAKAVGNITIMFYKIMVSILEKTGFVCAFHDSAYAGHQNLFGRTKWVGKQNEQMVSAGIVCRP